MEDVARELADGAALAILPRRGAAQ